MPNKPLCWQSWMGLEKVEYYDYLDKEKIMSVYKLLCALSEDEEPDGVKDSEATEKYKELMQLLGIRDDYSFNIPIRSKDNTDEKIYRDLVIEANKQNQLLKEYKANKLYERWRKRND